MIERCFKTGRQCEFELEESPDQVFVGIPFKETFYYLPVTGQIHK